MIRVKIIVDTNPEESDFNSIKLWNLVDFKVNQNNFNKRNKSH